MKLYIILAACAAIAGCASTLPGDPAKMSADQIKALATDKAAQAACTTGTGPWGAVRTIYVQWDRGSAAGGTVTVSPDCQVSITTEQRLPAVAKP